MGRKRKTQVDVVTQPEPIVTQEEPIPSLIDPIPTQVAPIATQEEPVVFTKTDLEVIKCVEVKVEAPVNKIVVEEIVENAEIECIPGKVEVATPMPSMSFEEDYFKQLKKSGLDVSVKGTWQRMFASFLIQNFDYKDKKMLDLGCAMGAQSSAFADLGGKVFGVDISQYAIEKGQKLFKNVEFTKTEAWKLPFVDNQLDFIFSMFMFNHIPQEKCSLMFKELKRVIKKDGYIFAILHISKEYESYAYNDNKFPKSFWEAIAQEHGMMDEARNYYPKLLTTKTPGIDFMRTYNWNFLVYKVKKEV